MMKSVDPKEPSEYMVKAATYVMQGVQQKNNEYLTIGKELLQVFGSSPSECDTIPGRQAMASCFFLDEQYGDCLFYFNSITAYFWNDDFFNYNYGQCLVQTGNYKKGEEVFLRIQNKNLQQKYQYVYGLAVCYLKNDSANNKIKKAYNESMGVNAEKKESMNSPSLYVFS